MELRESEFVLQNKGRRRDIGEKSPMLNLNTVVKAAKFGTLHTNIKPSNEGGGGEPCSRASLDSVSLIGITMAVMTTPIPKSM